MSAAKWGLAVAFAFVLPGTVGASSADRGQGGEVAASPAQGPGDPVIVGTLAARFDDSLRGGGVVAQGASFAGREDGVANTSAVITIAGIPAGATVQRALLYWMISGGTDTTATINAVSVTGVQVAAAGSTCWGPPTTPTFRADVTAQVAGNGAYTITGLPSSTNPAAADTNGVGLVVVYQNPLSGIVRRVMIRDGAISTSGSGEVVTDTFTGVAPPIASAGRFHLVVGDGQSAADGNLIFNGVTLGTNQFPGSDGSLWDVNSYNVNVPAAQANLTWTSQTGGDCLQYETAAVDFNVAVCGDGVIHSPFEQCDQGNTNNGDGCSAQCQVEPGWQCSGQPSVCVRVADLAVTKTDGQATAVPGEPLTYTIAASNAGPSAITGAMVGDAFPAALLGVTWTCVASAGSSCPPSGSGDINSPVDLLVGGTATFTATGTVSPSATGTLTNTATVAVPGGATDPIPANNAATDVDTLTPEGDLGVTKDDGQTTYFPGQALTYAIVASNSGPSTVTDAVVADAFPPELTGVAWTCTASAGSSCGTAAGAGDINATVSLLPAGSATFTATATVAMTATGPLANTATVTAPAGVVDPNSANNSATDTNELIAAEPAALAVDTPGNRVYEPNETAEVAPTWRNSGAAAMTLTGALANHTGPPGPTYSIADAAADYGAIAAGATSSCASTGDCYGVANVAATRPSTHWDSTAVETVAPTSAAKTWTLHVGRSFTDVLPASSFYRFIETLLHNGVTGGCTTTTYCPSASTTRAQMAVFVLVAKEGPTYAPAPCVAGQEVFADVPSTSPFCRWIEELSDRGVVAGCGGGNYCPASPVSRDQMSVFVLRALDPALNPPACAPPNLYADVPETSPFCRWIEELTNRGVVSGCGGGNYCPGDPVTREQMGVFLSVTFGLTLYGL
jgi:uncharacterized repeat protein (TIGR01451 family)